MIIGEDEVTELFSDVFDEFYIKSTTPLLEISLMAFLSSMDEDNNAEANVLKKGNLSLVAAVMVMDHLISSLAEDTMQGILVFYIHCTFCIFWWSN